MQFFFQVAVMSILLYDCTAWTLTKCMEKKLDSINTRILRAILNKSSWQDFTKEQLYGHLIPIVKTIQVSLTRHARHTPRDPFTWTSKSARTYILQFSVDTRCSLEFILGVIDDRDGWRERVREIRAGGATWWWFILVNFLKFFIWKC